MLNNGDATGDVFNVVYNDVKQLAVNATVEDIDINAGAFPVADRSILYTNNR